MRVKGRRERPPPGYGIRTGGRAEWALASCVHLQLANQLSESSQRPNLMDELILNLR